MLSTFWLGTHKPAWLERLDVPLFISHRRLREYTTLPRARAAWALDSGGFSELDESGRWTITPAAYVDAVRLYEWEIGNLQWAAPQDWMCEPKVRNRTGLTVRDHQERTVANFLELLSLAPTLPFVPVLQGWSLGDYHRCVEMYDRAGVDLLDEPLVGLGSVCRRQATSEIGTIVESLAALGLRLHGFGVKVGGLSRYASHLESADSMAWSRAARWEEPMPGCKHASCSNCPRYATRWYRQVCEQLHAIREHEEVLGTQRGIALLTPN